VTDPAAQAAALKGLHHNGSPLILPNAWDAASARLVAEHGFPAVATTSAGVAAALGYDDGENVPVAEMLAAVRRISRRVEVPVTADLESGYGLAPTDLVEALLEAGAVGLNVEDTDHAAGGLRDAGEQADRIAAIKAAGRTAGVDIVLNARVDVFLSGGAVEDGLARARRYAAAGADCVYPIFLADAAAIGRFVAEAGVPVNVMLHPKAPDLARLAELRVARVSLGRGLEQAGAAGITAKLETLKL
jgi:2-methylisocitrate lyase-like PEP mutase family enzyme